MTLREPWRLAGCRRARALFVAGGKGHSVTETILGNEPVIRLTIFVVVLGLVAAMEFAVPRRRMRFSRWRRWPSNFAIVALNTGVVRLLFPTAAVGVALVAEAGGWGLLNAVSVPAPVAIIAVLIFEVLLNAAAMFNHGNIHLPQGLDRGLRWIIVTPDMHRVHHSVVPVETNSNFGFNLPWWDRLLGT